MDQLKNIVVGVDFSEYSQVALEQAKRITRWNQTDLHLIHVVDKHVVHDLEKAMGAPYKEVVKNVRESTQEKVNELFAEDPLERRRGKSDPTPTEHEERRQREQRYLELKVDVQVGTPYEEILKRVEEVKGDLLMLGSNGSSDPRRGLGELATACVRKAPCRVMVVRPSHNRPFKKVLACIDFTLASEQVVEQGIRIARQDNSKLYVAHMFNPPWTAVHYRSPTSAASPDYQQQYKENLEGQLHHLIQAHQEAIKGLDLECRLVEAYQPADAVVDFAEQNDVDLVVIGSRGAASIKAWLLGTQAERIVNHAPVSVLVIKP